MVSNPDSDNSELVFNWQQSYIGHGTLWLFGFQERLAVVLLASYSVE